MGITIKQLSSTVTKVKGYVDTEIDDVKDLIGTDSPDNPGQPSGNTTMYMTENFITNVTQGGIPSGTEITTNDTVQSVIKRMLVQYKAPELTISINPSTTIYDVVTQSITSITIIANVVKVYSDIVSLKFFDGSTELANMTEGIADGGVFSFTYTPDVPITGNTTFKIVCSDGTTEVPASKSIYFVGKTYYGTVDASVSFPTESDIKALSSTLKNSKGYTYNNINMTNKKILYAYPTTFGKLTSIKDANNISYTNSYGSSLVEIDGIPYYVYLLKDAASVTGFTQIYA